MNILQPIFTDYYEPIIYKLHHRHSVIEKVNKMIHCGDPSLGGAMYGCPHCGSLKNRFQRSIQDWQHSILLSFGYDPLCCSECGTSMLVLEVYHKKTALFEQYRKVMKYG